MENAEQEGKELREGGEKKKDLGSELARQQEERQEMRGEARVEGGGAVLTEEVEAARAHQKVKQTQEKQQKKAQQRRVKKEKFAAGTALLNMHCKCKFGRLLNIMHTPLKSRN